jgi:hypothetical protein
VSADLFSFPSLLEETSERWRWPAPPFEWRHEPAPDVDRVQPCRIATPGGAAVEGELTEFDPAGSISFRLSADGGALSLPFARFRQLELKIPLKGLPPVGAPFERLPIAAEERDYRFALHGGGELVGRTMGSVETPEGVFLFLPVPAGLVRVFVPRDAYSGRWIGLSVQEAAAAHWAATPEDLLAAIARQQRAPVLPIGRALLAIGVVTPEQIQGALGSQTGELPLGEMLVRDGHLSRADLQTALAHKLGYPLVDLGRFPVQWGAARLIGTERKAAECRALPLMLDGARVIVAVDRLPRLEKLRKHHNLATREIVPVLATKSQIQHAIERLAQQEVWPRDVSTHRDFLDSAI